MSNKSLNSLRASAVEQAWARERELVLQGKGTRQWSLNQQAELIKTGKVTGFEGSHILGVKDHPEYAGDPNNIQFLPTIAHMDGVHNGNFRADTEEGLYNERTGRIDRVAEPGTIPEQEIVDLKDRIVYVPEQEAKRRDEKIDAGEEIDIDDEYGEEDIQNNLAYQEAFVDHLSGAERQQLSRESKQSVRGRDKADVHFGQNTGVNSLEDQIQAIKEQEAQKKQEDENYQGKSEEEIRAQAEQDIEAQQKAWEADQKFREEEQKARDQEQKAKDEARGIEPKAYGQAPQEGKTQGEEQPQEQGKATEKAEAPKEGKAQKAEKPQEKGKTSEKTETPAADKDQKEDKSQEKSKATEKTEAPKENKAQKQDQSQEKGKATEKAETPKEDKARTEDKPQEQNKASEENNKAEADAMKPAKERPPVADEPNMKPGVEGKQAQGEPADPVPAKGTTPQNKTDKENGINFEPDEKLAKGNAASREKEPAMAPSKDYAKEKGAGEEVDVRPPGYEGEKASSSPSKGNQPSRESTPAKESSPTKESAPTKESSPSKESAPAKESSPSKSSSPSQSNGSGQSSSPSQSSSSGQSSSPSQSSGICR